jgi:hypothetical protein
VARAAIGCGRRSATGCPSSDLAGGTGYAGKKPNDVVIARITGEVDQFTSDEAAAGFVGTESGEELVGIKGL